MWPPDLGPPDVQLTLPAFGSVFQDAEDSQAPLSSGGLCQSMSSIHSGGLGMCCHSRTSLSLSSLGRDLTSLLSSSCKTNHKTVEDFATTAHTDPENSTQTLSCYPQPSLPVSFMITTCTTSPSFCSPSTTSSSSSSFFTSSLSLSDMPRVQIPVKKTSQQQQKLQEEYHSIKQEPEEDFLPCNGEPLQINNQQRELFHAGPPVSGQNSSQSPLQSPRLNRPTGQDTAGDKQDQPCHWIDCSAAYCSQEELVRHIEKVHIDQRKGEEFACFWAGCVRRHKPFNARYKLLIHMRVHSGEKPNKCMVSQLDFVWVYCSKQCFLSCFSFR